MAASFPPSSRQRGVIPFDADSATLCATVCDPINVKCMILGCEVKCDATFGQQIIDCTRFGLCPQTVNACCTMLMKYDDDHAVCSDPLTMIAFPVNSAEMMGPKRLWNG